MLNYSFFNKTLKLIYAFLNKVIYFSFYIIVHKKTNLTTALRIILLIFKIIQLLLKT